MRFPRKSNVAGGQRTPPRQRTRLNLGQDHFEASPATVRGCCALSVPVAKLSSPVIVARTTPLSSARHAAPWPCPLARPQASTATPSPARCRPRTTWSPCGRAGRASTTTPPRPANRAMIWAPAPSPRGPARRPPQARARSTTTTTTAAVRGAGFFLGSLAPSLPAATTTEGTGTSPWQLRPLLLPGLPLPKEALTSASTTNSTTSNFRAQHPPTEHSLPPGARPTAPPVAATPINPGLRRLPRHPGWPLLSATTPWAPWKLPSTRWLPAPSMPDKA